MYKNQNIYSSESFENVALFLVVGQGLPFYCECSIGQISEYSDIMMIRASTQLVQPLSVQGTVLCSKRSQMLQFIICVLV